MPNDQETKLHWKEQNILTRKEFAENVLFQMNMKKELVVSARKNLI